MEVTPEQRRLLLSSHSNALHMFMWIYDVLQSDNISRKQYNILMRLIEMDPNEQKGYIIHEDEMFPVPVKVKKYQKLSTGWKQMNRFTAPGGQPKRSKKDK